MLIDGKTRGVWDRFLGGLSLFVFTISRFLWFGTVVMWEKKKWGVEMVCVCYPLNGRGTLPNAQFHVCTPTQLLLAYAVATTWYGG